LYKSHRIKYRHNAGIKAQFSDLFQAILHFWPFKYDYRARLASSDHYHPVTGTFKPHSKMVMATKLLFGRGRGIILVLKRVPVPHHGVQQMMQYTEFTKAFFTFKMSYSFKVHT
jgi:hypothetical protein